MTADFLIENMAKTRDQKEEMVHELVDLLNRMTSAVFVNYQGIKVVDIEDLRNQLREVGVEYHVVKNTLFKIALEKSQVKLDFGEFEGPVAVAFSFDDEIAPARVLASFGKNHKELQLLSGILEGEMIKGAKVVELSKLPTKDELLARIVGSINAPVSNIVGVFRARVTSIVHVLNAIAQTKE